MVAAGDSIVHELGSLYDTRGDVDLSGFVSTRGPLADDLLADLIELDSRRRESLGQPVELDRYLEAFPDLPLRAVPLDTAIAAALRSQAARRDPSEAAAELMRAHPHLAESIRVASALNEALRSTAGLIRELRPEAGRPLPCDFGPTLPTGRARYELRERLGAGSHGAVYLAADRQLSDPRKPAFVAIKVIARRENHRERQRLIEEATKARMVDHPNVVRVVDLGFSTEGEVYVVFEHVQGGTLEDAVKRDSGRLSAREAATIVAGIAHGVQAAHSVGLAHCDLKPSNVLMNEGGRPKVADFGVAVREESLPPEKRDDDGRIGSLAFMAPEQYRMEPGAMSCAADVYAAGGLLYWLLTGRLPNGQSAPEVARNLSRPGRGSAPDPAVDRPDIDPDLSAICRRAMASDPRDRYAAAESLARDLEAFLRNEPLAWSRPTAWRRARLLTRRQPFLVGGAILGVVGAVVGVGVAAATWSHSVRERLNLELRVANERLEVELQKSQVARDKLTAGFQLTDKIKRGRAELEWLPLMTLMESTLGQTVIIGPGGVDLWTDRIDVVQGFRDRARAEGRESDIDMCLWGIAQSFWMLRTDRVDEASAVITDVKTRLEAKIPGDRLVRYCGAIQACAAARRAMSLAKDAPPEHRDLESLRNAAIALEQCDAFFTPGVSPEPVRRMVLSTLAEIYSKGMLNDPNALFAVLNLQEAENLK